MEHFIYTFLFVVVIFVIFNFGRLSINSVVNRVGRDKNISLARIQYVRTALLVMWSFLALTAFGLVMGIGYQDIGIFFGSVFAVIGVALFAQWSILSNATASIIIYFFFPFRAGDYVKILDGDNSIEGNIIEIRLFHVILDCEGTLFTYPNAMVFQKAVSITSPTGRLNDKEKSDG